LLEVIDLDRAVELHGDFVLVGSAGGAAAECVGDGHATSYLCADLASVGYRVVFDMLGFVVQCGHGVDVEVIE